MDYNIIDAKLLAKMFLAGAKNLEAKKEWINELNVFPVPDGDTGTNMTMTIICFGRHGYEFFMQSHFIWFPARSKRKLWCYFITAFPWIHKGGKRLRNSRYPYFS